MPHSKRQRKRKRAVGDEQAASSVGRPLKQTRGEESKRVDAVEHALLVQYYPKLQTLRSYVLSHLPSSSRLRRKKIASIGASNEPSSKTPDDTELHLSRFLDSTIVAESSSQEKARPEPEKRWQKWMNFSQKGDESYVTLSDGVAGAAYSQSEIVDFVIWLLFSKETNPRSWPKHVLCDGFRRNSAPNNQGPATMDSNSIPGLYRVHDNNRVQALKQSPWPLTLTLLGQAGEKMMLDLLLDCSVFVSLEAGKANYYQVSGEPISDLLTLNSIDKNRTVLSKGSRAAEKSPSEIGFVRSRMLYARAALNARGLVQFGLRHIHVLNRCPVQASSKHSDGQQEHGAEEQSIRNRNNTTRVMMYMFPRQFGLHNVFTSQVDHTQTAQKFQDYTLREEEILKRFSRAGESSQSLYVHVPRRLRGTLSHLVERLQILHSRCSYAALLQHYCSVQNQVEDVKERRTSRSLPQAGRSYKKHQKTRRKSQQTSTSITPTGYSSLVELATPISSISAFCRAVLSKIIPNEFWGTGISQLQNKKNFMRQVDHFIRLRRFETMSLHEVMNGLKITDIEWLTPPALKGKKCSQTDFRKRTEIFLEFVYYLFDSLLIPLIRSNFYVTESNVHRYRLFYFRHDVWRYIAEPAMTSIRARMFEEVKMDDAMRILDSRRLGFSQVRLLPKETSVRPITNLRRRTLTRNNRKILGPSINSILGPVHSMLKLEKSLEPDRLGSTMFSVGDIYKRVKDYKQRLGLVKGKFYIAKVDVQAAFDTIPQQAIIDLMASVPTHKQYKIIKHVEVKPNDSGTLTGAATTRRWHSSAKAAKDASLFVDMIRKSLAPSRKNTIFIDSVVQKVHQSKDLLTLMTQHIQQNLVKIGKKYYRQKDGVPQGSILSSLLCNYFYADLERHHLEFLQSKDCLLLRLIDDFLLITTDKSKASRFVQVMHQGMPEYGVTVSPHKSLVNFDLDIDGLSVPRLPDGSTSFPYCGTRLNCRTLEIAKDRASTRDPVISNALTVEFARLPGQNFKRKVLNAFRIQSHLMFFDTTHNSPQTTLKNIYDALYETATKMWAYAKCLPRERQPGTQLLIQTIRELVDVSFLLLTSKSRKARYPGYECTVKKTQVLWLALHAFKRVLEKKQARYREFLAWLDVEIRKLAVKKDGCVNITL